MFEKTLFFSLKHFEAMTDFQVCKLKRSLHLLDNSKTAETLMNNHDCPFKHLHLFSITDIKRLIDVEDTNGTQTNL